jgi:hypothetical protein
MIGAAMANLGLRGSCRRHWVRREDADGHVHEGAST